MGDEPTVNGPETIDIALRRDDRVAIVYIIVVDRMTPDPRVFRMLDEKIATYRHHILAEQLHANHAHERRTWIKVVAGEEPDPLVRQWIRQRADTLRPEGIELVLLTPSDSRV